MNFVEKRKRELMAEAKAKAEKEAMQAYAKAWDAIARCMGSELSEKVLEAACESGLKTSEERVKKVGEILQHSRFGFWPRNEPETVKPVVPVAQSACCTLCATKVQHQGVKSATWAVFGCFYEISERRQLDLF